MPITPRLTDEQYWCLVRDVKAAFSAKNVLPRGAHEIMSERYGLTVTIFKKVVAQARKRGDLPHAFPDSIEAKDFAILWPTERIRAEAAKCRPKGAPEVRPHLEPLPPDYRENVRRYIREWKRYYRPQRTA